MEVPVPCGRIDVLTDSEIIEVKEAKGWKGAIGQIISYGIYYPERTKRIHLFGKCSQKTKALISSHCAPLDIRVTFAV